MRRWRADGAPRTPTASAPVCVAASRENVSPRRPHACKVCLFFFFFLPYFHRTVPSWFDRPRSAVFLELFFSHKFCQHLNLTGLLATHSTGYRCFKSSWRASFSLSGFENALQIRNQCRPLARRIAREMGHFAYDSARRHRIGSFRCHSARPRLS